MYPEVHLTDIQLTTTQTIVGMLFAFEKTPHISLGCKLVLIQNQEFKYGIFTHIISVLFLNDAVAMGMLIGIGVLVHVSVKHRTSGAVFSRKVGTYLKENTNRTIHGISFFHRYLNT